MPKALRDIPRRVTDTPMPNSDIRARETTYEPDDEPTPIACIACAGNFRANLAAAGPGMYRVVNCGWCTDGVMSLQQVKDYALASRARAVKKDPRNTPW